MSISELTVYLPKGCNLWSIETSSLETQHVLILPDQKKFQISHTASQIIEELVDKPLSIQELASKLSAKWNTDISVEDLLKAFESEKWPRGLVRKGYGRECEALEDGAEERKQSSNLLGTFFIRHTLVPAGLLRRIAQRLTWLYERRFAAFAILTVLVVHGLLLQHLLAPSTRLLQAFRLSAAQYLAALGLMFAGVVVHELGHAVAAKRCGINPGEIGIGLYLIYPALYTELGFAWFLPRMQRVLIDAGGFYFQFLFTVPLYCLFRFTHTNIYLVVLLSLDFLFIASLFPLFKFDGYWLLSDGLGVPNMQKRSLEVLLSPFSLFRSGPFISKSGLVLPKRITAILFLYALLFVPFQTFFAFMITKRGVPALLHTPWAAANLLKTAFADVAAGKNAEALYFGFKTFMLLVTALSLVLIFRAYLKIVWRVAQKLRKRLEKRKEAIQGEFDYECGLPKN